MVIIVTMKIEQSGKVCVQQLTYGEGFDESITILAAVRELLEVQKLAVFYILPLASEMKSCRSPE